MTIIAKNVELMTRKNWIDWMKVIGITAVVWGHFFPDGMSDFIYAFNVPVFFVVSGYLTKEDRDMKENAHKVAVALVIPYLLLALIKVAGYVFKHITDGKALYSLLFVLTGVHDYNGISGCNNLWFVYTLIIIKLLFPLIRKRPVLIAILAFASLVCGKFYADLDVDIAWAIPDVLLSFPFFALGYLLRYAGRRNNMVSRGMHAFSSPTIGRSVFFPVWFIFTALLTFFLSSFNGEVHMFSAHYGNNIFLFLGASITGIIMIGSLSMWLNKVHWSGLRIISTGTIVILTFHREFVHPLSKLIDKLDINILEQNLLIFVLSVAIVLVFIPIIMILERYVPILVGKRK